MSATRSDESAESVSNQGEFHSSVPRSEPLTTSGHKPGVIASEADSRPEFSAQTLPAGSAPRDKTHQPNPTDEVPRTTDYTSQGDPESGSHSASDTLGGATSADVHTGYGHPGQGQTSSELRHDGQHTSSKRGTGLVGVGASSIESGGVANASKVVNPSDPAFANQRALDKEEGRFAGQRGNIGGPAAEERFPESAETVAREAPSNR